MKKSIIIILIIILFFNQISAFADEITITKRKEIESEDYLWEQLNKYIDNPKIAAGILAFFWRESFCQSDSVAGYYYLGKTAGEKYCKNFRKIVDKGLVDGSTKKYFIETCQWHGGYGLGQWWPLDYIDAFYDFAQQWGTSIADAEMQCAFTIENIKNNPNGLWDLIKDEDDIIKIGEYIGLYYDGSALGAELISWKIIEYYNRYNS